MEKKLIKIDRNGSKHFEGHITCDRCQGRGEYWWGAMIYEMGATNPRPQYSGVCFKCNGAGVVLGKWIERTPEYQAKLDAKREAKWEKIRAEREAEAEKHMAEREAIKAEREARIKAEKAVSQYVGEVGQRISEMVTFLFSGSYEVRSFSGYGTETMYVHNFKDEAGNKLVWKTSKWLGFEDGTQVKLTGTVKEHSDYKEEKQTVLTRCKVTV